MATDNETFVCATCGNVTSWDRGGEGDDCDDCWHKKQLLNDPHLMAERILELLDAEPRTVNAMVQELGLTGIKGEVAIYRALVLLLEAGHVECQRGTKTWHRTQAN